MASLPSVCVIGAGSSGIAALKALHAGGFSLDCFEASDRVGGNWVWGNTNGMSSAYRSLHINTSRERMEYSDFPMPKSYPDFPHHTHIARYFDDYVDHFGIRDRIRFETGVEHAARRSDGVWEITLEDGSPHEYDALIVANGHHWDARWPEPAFPGSDDFGGVQIHSHDYKGDDPDFFRDKTVVVLGMGNSAMDIAVEASFVAEHTYLAARRGAHVLPKYLFGKPIDQISTQAGVPLRVRQAFFRTLLRVGVGDMERYGLPKPEHGVLSAHPTISDDILSRIAHGAIAPKPNIARLTERTVVFADGSEVEADIVIYCTGYKVTFPFFDPALIAAPDNDLPLFRRVFHPRLGSVFFIGLLQPLGAIMPIAAVQSEWVCDYLSGRYALPDPAALRADIEHERERMFKRYVASKRHTMQVDYDDYLADLVKERRRGAERAQARGHALPVRPRAVEAAAA
ncbi:MAG TPA: NAD(P)-binding domain-containing protein [Solirubrobacteraceae bacterium]|nr:NAD(P)-binding domain-containing protein [Solirubrobacteraceae bacterium]